MINTLKSTACYLLILGVLSCGTGKITGNSVPGGISLQEAYADDFLIGTALSAGQIRELDTAAARVIRKDFNAITPENIMKAEIIHPAWDRYDFGPADQIIALGQKNGQKVNGHTLIWHSQLPGFVRNMKNADSVRLFFEDHIRTVAGRYAGKIFSWDVVNEALEEDGSLRKSIFLEKLGPGYIVEAFRLAEKASPGTELYYNDYNIEQPRKRAGAIHIIKELKAAGVRIDGVGIQGHWRSGKVPLKEIEESIKEFAALGVKVMFTELDLGVLPNPWDFDAADVNQRAEYSEKMNPYKNGLPDSVRDRQVQSYADLFRLFLRYREEITRVTFWGVNDGQSWLNDWPIRGRTNYPLLFDRRFMPKPAYDKLIEIGNSSAASPKGF